MVALLSRWLIPDRDNPSSPIVRRAYGVLCGSLGIVLNLLLFLGKLFAGMLSGSIAITADAFNNLSDAGSSLITLIGFRLAGQKPDPDHPFGHGRIEYISGLIVSMAILVMGFELGKTSIEKILHPSDLTFSPLILLILVVSILVKMYMFFYNHKIGGKLDSTAMRATALDSLSDCLATLVVVIATLASHYMGWHIDGYCGVVVAIFIFWTGIRAARETISPLLGQAPDPALVQQIEALVLAHESVIGIHDLVVHDYGPGRVMISLHAEVSAAENFAAVHDTIDNIERELADTLGCEATIHMDPIATDDALTNEARAQITALAHTLDPRMTIHDFRMVTGPTHTNVIFDLVTPFGCPYTDTEAKAAVARLVESLDGDYFAVITIDKPYL